MFTDPITLDPTVTFNSTTVTLPRVSQNGTVSTYQAGPLSVFAGSQLQVVASHQFGRRIRRSLRLNYADNAGSTLVTGSTQPRSMSCYVVFDIPSTNAFTVVEQKALFNGLKGTWNASTDALLTKLLGGES